MEQSYIAYFHFQVRSFRKNFIRSTSRKNFDEIHDYRVALKRIRTITNFAQKIPGSKNLLNCYKINKLQSAFKAGGILREIQINRIILARYELNKGLKYTGFREYLNKKEKSSFRDLKVARDKFSATKLKKFESKLIGVLKKTPTPLFLKLIDQFVEKRIAQIKDLVKAKNVESTLHRIRRQTKSIKYLLEMSQTGSKSFGDLKFEIDKITELEDLIGDWHDQQVFKFELNEYNSTIQKRNMIDPQTKSLSTIVTRDYNKIFNQTVQAVYDHYKIEAGKN